ncbi:unnamed protein product [Prunus armeniaca]
MAKDKGKARTVTIYVNSNSPYKRLVVFPPIVMATTIHMRYEEMNLYRVLVWEQTKTRARDRFACGLAWFRGTHNLLKQVWPVGRRRLSLDPVLPLAWGNRWNSFKSSYLAGYPVQYYDTISK